MVFLRVEGGRIRRRGRRGRWVGLCLGIRWEEVGILGVEEEVDGIGRVGGMVVGMVVGMAVESERDGDGGWLRKEDVAGNDRVIW